MESQSDLPLPVRLALATPDYAPTWQWSPMRYLGASPTTTQHVADSAGTSLGSLRAALTILSYKAFLTSVIIKNIKLSVNYLYIT